MTLKKIPSNTIFNTNNPIYKRKFINKLDVVLSKKLARY